MKILRVLRPVAAIYVLLPVSAIYAHDWSGLLGAGFNFSI
jgi:hypothetical protein